MAALFILLSSSFVIHFVATERQFYFVDLYTDWTSAQTYCRTRHGGDLVTVFNAQDNEKLASIGQYDCAWLGLHHVLNTWRWSMDNTVLSVPLDVGFWGLSQPNNLDGNQHCAAVSTVSGGVSDTSCTDNHYFMCSDAVNQHILVQELKTWEDAKTYCRANHKDLATISTDQVSKIVIDMTLQGITYVWIGLYRDPWSVWSDNSYTNYSNWASGPNYLSYSNCGCLTISTGKWIERHCTADVQFFCYGDAAITTTAPSSTTVGMSTTVTVQPDTTTTAAPLSTLISTSTAVTEQPVKPDVGKQTVLKLNLQSEIDLGNKQIQLQILEQMKNRLASTGVTNITLKWRVNEKITPEAVLNVNCPKNILQDQHMEW